MPRYSMVLVVGWWLRGKVYIKETFLRKVSVQRGQTLVATNAAKQHLGVPSEPSRFGMLFFFCVFFCPAKTDFQPSNTYTLDMATFMSNQALLESFLSDRHVQRKARVINCKIFWILGKIIKHQSDWGGYTGEFYFCSVCCRWSSCHFNELASL